MTVPNQPPAADRLTIALLLAGAGGMLDAIVYLTHGHVFANAMTGNVVLLGITLLTHDYAQAIRHLVPLCAFLAGIVAAKACRTLPDRHAIAFGVLFEIVALAGSGFLPNSFSPLGFVAIIAFASTFQTANFRKVRRFAYNTTFVTGNLRDMAEGVYDSLRPSLPPDKRAEGRAQALALAAVCACFFLGVLAGAWTGPRFQNHALWFTLPLLAAVAGFLFFDPPKTVLPDGSPRVAS